MAWLRGLRSMMPHPLVRAGYLVVGVLACVVAPMGARGADDASRGFGAREQRVALVIGNAAYRGSAALRNPVNDASDVADKLKTLGFDVILRTDVGQREMTRAITQFGDRLGPGSVGLFFYAGHGVQVRGRNYLIPVDAEISGESSVRSESVDLDQAIAQLSAARIGVVVLDACRNNPFERSFRAGAGGGLAQIDAPKGTLIAYSTAPGNVAADGAGRNSPFTAAFLGALDLPGRTVEQLFKEVRVGVARATGDRQIPWESSSLTGDFYFRTAAAASPAPIPATPAAGPPAATSTGGAGRSSDETTLELAFWDSIRNSRDAGDYAAYLEQYPSGRFAALARSRLRSLGSTPASAATPPQAALVPPAAAPGPAGGTGTVASADPPGQWPTWTYRYVDKSVPSSDRRLAQRLVEVGADRIREQLQEPGTERPSETVFPAALVLQFSGDFGRMTPVLKADENFSTCNRGRLIMQGLALATDCRAQAHEKVVVPAGEFDGQRIEITADPVVGGAATRRPLLLTVRAWYDIRSRRLLKQELRITTNNAVTQEHREQLIELVDTGAAARR